MFSASFRFICGARGGGCCPQLGPIVVKGSMFINGHSAVNGKAVLPGNSVISYGSGISNSFSVGNSGVLVGKGPTIFIGGGLVVNDGDFCPRGRRVITRVLGRW